MKYCFLLRLNLQIISLKGCSIGDDGFKIFAEGLVEK